MKTVKANNVNNSFKFGANYFDSKMIDSLHLSFGRNGYVKLPGLIALPTFNLLKAEVQRLSGIAIERNFVMQGYESPRIMTTLGGQQIAENSELLKNFYGNQKLRSVLSGIVGSPLFDCPDVNEWCVSTWLNGEGQTHGHHLDDPPIALIVIIEAPPPELGGFLEVVTDWREIARIFEQDPERNVLPLVNKLRNINLVQVKTHITGDAYLLRADQCLHAVAPLRGRETKRSILNMAFELEPNIARRSETAAALFET